MEVNCEGCAGCCIDWRPISPTTVEHERGDGREPLDDLYDLVPLTRDDAVALLEAGLADATRPRLWRLPEEADPSVTIDGTPLVAIDGKPAFFLGLRKPPKPVAPFDRPPTWLSTCVFLDPATLQCRIHDAPHYPEECADYPVHNLALDVETECERVESAFGGDRLLDDAVPSSLSTPMLGPQAIGSKLFVHPRPDVLEGVVERSLEDHLTDEDRASFLAAAVASSPGTTGHDAARFERTYERALAADSWAGRSADAWRSNRGRIGTMVAEDGDGAEPGPTAAGRREERDGAPPTPGWPTG